MLSDQEKKEMLADGLSQERREGFRIAEQKKPRGSRSLNNYLAFLMSVQKIHPFEHPRTVSLADKNIL